MSNKNQNNQSKVKTNKNNQKFNVFDDFLSVFQPLPGSELVAPINGDALTVIAAPDTITTVSEAEVETTGLVSGPAVTTNKPDYTPGGMATFTASGFAVGSTIQFDIADDPDRPGDDGEADIYAPIVVTDGVTTYNAEGAAVAGDLDGLANGQVVTTWLVPTDNNGTGSGAPDALNATLNLTATGSGADGVLGTGDDQSATTTFTDSFIYNNANQALLFNAPTLISGTARGTALNSKIRFANVRTIDGKQIDAIVTVSQLNNATITGFDTLAATADQAPLITNVTDNVLSLNTNIGANGGDVTITVDFVIDYNATTNPNGTLVTLQNVIINSYDIDGVNGDSTSNNLQYQEFTGDATYRIITGTSGRLTASQSGQSTRFQTSQGGNVTQGPGTSGGDVIRVQANYDSLSSFTLKTGGGSSGGAGGIAYYYLDFSAGSAFSTTPTVFYTLSGSVLQDLDNDNAIDNPGDTPLSGVTVNLYNSGGTFLRSTTTNADGDYFFGGLGAGTYKIQKVNPTGLFDITDIDGGNANEITATISSANVTGRDFLVDAPRPTVDLNSLTTTITTSSSDDATNRVRTADFGTSEVSNGSNLTGWTESTGTGNTFGAVVLDGSDGRWLWETNGNLGTGVTLTQTITVPGGTTTPAIATSPTSEQTTETTNSDSISSITFGYGWNNRNNNRTNTLTVSYGGTPYATFTTNNSNSATASWNLTTEATLLNATLSGETSSSSINATTGDLRTVMINLPTGITASGNLVFTYGNGTSSGGNPGNNRDSIAIDNVVINTTTTTTVTTTTADGGPVSDGFSGYDWATTYNPFGTNPPAKVIADTDSSVFDPLSVNINQATVTLTNPQSGDKLLVNGVDEASGTFTSGDFNGISWTRTNGTQVVFSGVKTQAIYANLIEAVQFSSPGTTNYTNREVTVFVQDVNNEISNTAKTIITIEQPASVSGFVYVDADNDGIKDAGEVGLGGVTVTLTGTNDLGSVNLTTTTNGTGAYSFGNLRPGTYTVTETTQPTGYFDGLETAGTINGTPTGSTATNENITNIVIGAGQSSINNNFGELEPASISGFVYGDADNDGTKETDENGISGVEVTLSGTDDLGNAVSATATTDGTGAYSFTGLRPSNASGYTLTETQPSGFLDGKETAGTTGGTVNNAAVSQTISNISLGAGVDSENNNFGELAPASISGFVYVDTDNDGVQETGETGISGVTVTLSGTDDLGNAVSATTTTDGTGAYSFTGLRPSNASGYTLTETQPVTFLDGKETAGTAGGSVVNNAVSQTISGIVLGSGINSTDNNFGELEPASISGFVYADTDNDGTKETGENGISGVEVTLSGTDDLGNTVSLTTTTDGTGAYSFGNLRPGTYTVTETTQPTGYFDGLDTQGNITPINGSNTTDVISFIALTAGQSNTGNNFGELLPGSITGTVQADNNNDDIADVAIAGVILTLVDANGNPVDGNPNVSGVQPITAQTDRDGNYSFTNLVPGTYGVKETQPSVYASVSDKDGGDLDEIRPITVTSGQTNTGNDFLEELFGTITGRVLADIDNNNTGDLGIPGVLLTLVDDSGNDIDGNPDTPGTQSITVTTDVNGFYRFNNLAPGNYGVKETQPSGYTSVSDKDGGDFDEILPITVTTGQINSGNDFVEEKLNSISGKVLDDGFGTQKNTIDSSDKGISDVTLTLINSVDGIFGNGNDVTVGTATTGNDGSYSFTGLGAGTYRVVETQPSGYTSVTDRDGTNDDQIDVIFATGSGEVSINQDFLEESPTASFRLNKSVVDVLNSDNSTDSDGIIDIAGDKVVYRITLQNTGNVAIASPVVNDPLVGGNLPNSTSGNVVFGGDGATAGTLDIAETWTYDVTYTITAPDLTTHATTNALDQVLDLPDTVTLRTLLPGTTYSLMGTTRDSYGDALISSSSPDGFSLDGWFNLYCVDVDHRLSPVTYTAKVFSSYDTNILNGSLNSIDPTLNFGVDRPENFDLVNWVLNENYLTQTATVDSQTFTAGDIQAAIWLLIDDTGSTADLAPYSPARAQEIYNDVVTQFGASAIDNATVSYTPDFGDKVAILLTPINAQGLVITSQKTIIEYTLTEAGLRNTAIATASGVADSTDFVDVGVDTTPTVQPITYNLTASQISGLTLLTGAEGSNTDTVMASGPGASFFGIANPTETVGAGFAIPTRFDGIDSLDAANNGSIIYGTSGNNYFNLAAIGDGVNDITDKFSQISLNIGNDTVITGDSLNPTAAAHPTYGNAIIILAGSGNDLVDASGETNTQVAMLGQAGNDTLIGGAQADILIGGQNQDTLTGNGGADRFQYLALTDSLLSGYDTITDFNADVDKLWVTNAPASVFNAGAIANLNATTIANALSAINFVSNGAATFTVGTDAFIAINNGTAGFSATTDAIIRITNYTGTLGAGMFTTI